MRGVATRPRRRLQRVVRSELPLQRAGFRPSGLALLIASEGFAAALGFVALVHQARRLGPEGFASVEYAAGAAAWLLVLVRGGFDVVVYREAARRPRLIGPLTDLLVGLRLAAACVGYLLALGLAFLLGPTRGVAVAIAALGLFASAGVTDVGLRAQGRLGWLAVGQVLRSLGMLAAVLVLVNGSGDVLAAALCLVSAEILGALVPFVDHSLRVGLPRPKFRERATLILARRGTVAGLSRFLRVTLYGADLLLLGWRVGADLGEYAAARRVVFALVALGLVVPAALAPSVAVAWAAGVWQARRRVGALLGALWAVSLPAAIGIGMTADRWMPLLFSDAYREGGPFLALVVARLPWLLAAAFAQSALVACRREDLGLRLVLAQLAVAALVMPLGLFASGPSGIGWAAVAVEAAGAILGWAYLARLGATPGWVELTAAPLGGCLALVAACNLTRGAPLTAVVLVGALAYAMGWNCLRRMASLRKTGPVGAWR